MSTASAVSPGSSAGARAKQRSLSGALAAALALALPAIRALARPADRYFTLQVIDEATGRGVPLVELKTVNHIASWTDSAGVVAWNEPGLMGQSVYFHIASPGYEYPEDTFHQRGIRLRVEPGGQAKITLRRRQIAERLYRVTGQGIYRDSLLVGAPVPLREPALNAQVLGQDTVIVTPYRGRLYWFWGDTDRAGFHLGNFSGTGATSEWPERGGLAPHQGINLDYFTNAEGFTRAMCPESSFGAGLKWIEGVMSLRDADGQEHLWARVAAGTGLGSTRDWHLARFNDATQCFESVVRWDIHDSHDSSHPFRARVDGQDYLYIYPDLRVRAQSDALRDLKNYEAFTCVAGEGHVQGTNTLIARDALGRARYAWRAGADRLHGGRMQELTRMGLLAPEEHPGRAYDVETGASVEAGRGSVFWNEFRRRWLRIHSGRAGEIWLGEADTPTGPWAYERRIAEHGRYNFYNPTQHPFFDESGGRVLYFEGTYTATFSDAPARTPRYEYNQLMYRLTLTDPRLDLPAPVYRVKRNQEPVRYLMREDVEAEQAWAGIQSIAFYAIPAARRPAGLIPIYTNPAGTQLQTNAPRPGATPIFYALPATAASPPTPLLSLASPTEPDAGALPGWVWKTPSALLPLDFPVQPLPPEQPTPR